MAKGKRFNASEALLLRAGYASVGTGLRGAGYRELSTGQTASYASIITSVQNLNGGSEGLTRAIIAQLEARVPANKLEARVRAARFHGKIFTLSIPDNMVKQLRMAEDGLQRIAVLYKSRDFIAEQVHVDKNRIMPLLQASLRQLISQIMDETVYDQPGTDVIYYDVGGGSGYAGDSTEGLFPKREPTGNLKRAMVEGLRVVGDMIHWSIDENYAPYWLWVDQGHRVFLPDGKGGSREIGVWVVGRKFVRKIELAIAQLSDNFTGVLAQKYKGVINGIGAWALHGSQYLNATSFAVVHYPEEFGGYTDAFYRYVGVQQ